MARLRATDPGRLVIDEAVAGAGPTGWVESTPMVGATALVRLSTAAVTSAEAVAEVVGAVLGQAREVGCRRIVVETDDPGRLPPEPGMVVVPPMRVTNSLGRRQERIETLVPGRLGMYSCGPTVYSYQHIGNLRAYVCADTLGRALRWRGIEVHHVVNITDVGHLLADADEGEDKVEQASRKEGRTVDEVTDHYTQVYWDDLRALAVMFPFAWPKASAYVEAMIEFATGLEARGFAYRLPGGLYFDTARQPAYGELAGLDAEGLREGARVGPVAGKRSKTDFALWRTFTDGQARLMQWDSPWGVGAPGWHLECSVMSMALLGEHFDIHTGGIDHRELHHVNEIAQSEAYLGDGQRWVRYWVHNEFLTFRSSKMSKSAGGTIRLADLVEMGVHPLAYRYLLLQSTYGSQLEFSDTAAQAAQVALVRLARRVRDALGPAAGSPSLVEPITLAGAVDAAADLVRAGPDPAGAAPGVLLDRLLALDAAVADDLMTPVVLAMANTWAKDPLSLGSGEWEVLVRALNTLTGLSLGLLAPIDLAPRVPPDLDLGRVEACLAERDAARAARDWAAADRLRAELADAGIHVEDTPEGTHWHLG